MPNVSSSPNDAQEFQVSSFKFSEGKPNPSICVHLRITFAKDNMRALAALAIYLAVVFGGGALLAPPVYQAVQGLAKSQPENGVMASLAKQPFHRYVHRLMLVLAIGWAWPLARIMGLRNRRDLGLTFDKHSWRDWARGFAIGFGVLLAGALAALFLGPRQWNGVDLTSLGGAMFAALLVPMIEELIFRGLIHGGLRRQAGFWPALGVSSAAYGILHFFARPENPARVQWNSGLMILAGMCRGFTDTQQMIPALLTLVLLGMVFALAYERTGTLWLAMGIHGGLIFWVKTYAKATRADQPSLFWGTDKMVDGWMALILGAGLLGLMAVYTRRAGAEAKV